MTRFARELAGDCGAYWKQSAERELEKISAELEQGLITIDEQGIGRNRIGRVLASEMTEKVSYITDRIDPEATARARDEETTKALEAYRRNYKGPSEEEKAEMRATFGATVVDIITGERIRL